MSINMERFGSEAQFPAYDAYRHLAGRAPIFQLQCRSCGYEPEGVLVPPKLCPKCHGESWERFVIPGSILTNAERC